MSDTGDTIRFVAGAIAVAAIICTFAIALAFSNGGEDPDPRLRCLDHHSYSDCQRIFELAPTEETHGD